MLRRAVRRGATEEPRPPGTPGAGPADRRGGAPGRRGGEGGGRGGPAPGRRAGRHAGRGGTRAADRAAPGRTRARPRGGAPRGATRGAGRNAPANHQPKPGNGKPDRAAGKRPGNPTAGQRANGAKGRANFEEGVAEQARVRTRTGARTQRQGRTAKRPRDGTQKTSTAPAPSLWNGGERTP